jgi:hypothetical protein
MTRYSFRSITDLADLWGHRGNCEIGFMRILAQGCVYVYVTSLAGLKSSESAFGTLLLIVGGLNGFKRRKVNGGKIPMFSAFEDEPFIFGTGGWNVGFDFSDVD